MRLAGKEMVSAIQSIKRKLPIDSTAERSLGSLRDMRVAENANRFPLPLGTGRRKRNFGKQWQTPMHALIG